MSDCVGFLYLYQPSVNNKKSTFSKLYIPSCAFYKCQWNWTSSLPSVCRLLNFVISQRDSTINLLYTPGNYWRMRARWLCKVLHLHKCNLNVKRWLGFYINWKIKRHSNTRHIYQHQGLNKLFVYASKVPHIVWGIHM